MFIYHDAFNPDTAEVEDLKTRYRAGQVGDVEVKNKLAKALNASRCGRAGQMPSRTLRFCVTSPRGITQSTYDRAGNDGSRQKRGEAQLSLGVRGGDGGNGEFFTTEVAELTEN